MKKLLINIIIILISTTITFAQGIDCSDATAITANSSQFSIVVDSDGQYYYFIPSQNGNITLTINAMNPSPCNVKVEVSNFIGTQLGACVPTNTANQIIANPDGSCPGAVNSKTFAITAGEDYYIRVYTDIPAAIENYELIINADVPLPVELLSQNITQVEEKVLLEWSTATELNNSHFEIMRSSDGKAFETIGEVRGNGNTTEISDYEFIDENPITENYYKIVQYDFDGIATAFDILQLNINKGTDLKPIIYSDGTQLILKHSAKKNSDYQVCIINASGQVLHTESINLNEGENQVFVNPSEKLPIGLYFISLQNEQKTSVNKVVLTQALN